MRGVALFVRAIERALALVIGALVIVLLALVVLQFVDRHFFDVGIDAPDQLVRIGIIWLCFLGFASALQAGENIRIEFLDQWLSPSWRRTLGIIYDALMLCLCVFLAFKGIAVVEVGAGQQLLGTPFSAALPNAGYLVGMVVTAVFLVARIARKSLSRIATER